VRTSLARLIHQHYKADADTLMENLADVSAITSIIENSLAKRQKINCRHE